MARVILITGAESSGTRWMASVIGQHPDFNRVPTQDRIPKDPLDDFWERKTDVIPDGLTLSRRSLPAKATGSKVAKYLEFEDYTRLANACELKVVVTVRSPHPNMASMKSHRASVKGSFKKARIQYQAAYRHLFRCLEDVEYYLMPLEAVILDGDSAISGLFHLLGLPPFDVAVEADESVNRKWVTAITS